MRKVLLIAGVFIFFGLIGCTSIQPYFFDNGPDYFVEGVARFVENGKIGFYNEQNEKVIPAQFDWASPFENGVAEVCNECKAVREDEHERMQGGKWGTVNMKGEVLWKQ